MRFETSDFGGIPMLTQFLLSVFWFAALLGVAMTLAYRRIDLATSTIVMGFALLAYGLIGNPHWLWMLLLWAGFALLVLLNFRDFRRERISAWLLGIYREILPPISDTEREALEAGTVWWDGELFSGRPDWGKLTSLPAAKLSDEERAFIEGPTEELCRLIDDWEISHELADISPEIWAFIKEHRFFAMIIPKEYGGLDFSPYAVASVLVKLSSRSLVVASTVGVPNSLGPAELLLHYGTKEQQDRYLPGLACGEEIPCFALTGPRVGSDASSLPDTGVVCKGQWNGEEIIGLRLNWDKRYITLAPVATVLGLAFKLYDPDHLIGDRDEYGITAALIPTDTEGVEIGRRHFPLNAPFQNGPTRGKDVFVPLDSIIGGTEMAGQGWRMLTEQLAAGRGIVLPSNACGGAQSGVYGGGAYTRIRQQFNLPVSKFEGVGEVLARMAARTYIINAGIAVTCSALARGEKPAVPSAILKYHCTELGRMIANDAMDIHGGKGIMLGPKNYLGRTYQATPIAITVEGANILTRSLMIYGQGAIRCHPWVLKEMEAAANEDIEQGLIDFDESLFGHVGYAISNAARSFVLAMTHAKLSPVPQSGSVARFYQHINRYSAAFALASDVAMLNLGGELKRRESLSARLGDVFSSMYLASMVLKHYDNQGRPEEDLPIVEWACRSLLYDAQEQLHSFLRNFPNRILAAALRMMIFPRGRMYSAPADELSWKIVDLMTYPTESRDRLCAGIYTTTEPGNPLGLLQEALEATEAATPLANKVRDARRSGIVDADDPRIRIDQAESAGVLTADEAAKLKALDDQVMALIAVDDFSSEELQAGKA